MKKSTITNLLSFITVAALAAALAGCASHNYEQGAKTGANLTAAADKIAAGNGKIDATLASLNDLVGNPQGDLSAKYGKFSDNVNDLQSTASSVDDRVNDMQGNSDKYFKAWDEQLAKINNEDIKSRSSQRKQEVMSKFNDIKTSYGQAKEAFKPFMSDLKDIQTALGTDLTVGGVSSIKGAADKANQDAIPLKSAITQLSQNFRDLGVSMASSTPQPQ